MTTTLWSSVRDLSRKKPLVIRRSAWSCPFGKLLQIVTEENAQSLNNFTLFLVSLAVSFSKNPWLNSKKLSSSLEKSNLFLEGSLFSLPAGRERFGDFAIITASWIANTSDTIPRVERSVLSGHACILWKLPTTRFRFHIIAYFTAITLHSPLGLMQ